MVVTTTEKILKAALKLLEASGSEGVTVRAVATRVGLTPMALYRHFENRDALLASIADQGFSELALKLAEVRNEFDLEISLAKNLDLQLDFAFKHPELFKLMFLDKRNSARTFPRDFVARKSPTANLAADAIAAAMKTGLVKKDNVWEIVFETGAMIQGLILLYLGGRVEMNDKDFRKYCHRALRRYWDGIRA